MSSSEGETERRRPFAAWFCFAIGISLMVICVAAVLAAFAHSNGNWQAFKALITDYRSSVPFKERTAYYFSSLNTVVTDPGLRETAKEYMIHLLDSEGENLKYYAISADAESVVTNIQGAKDGSFTVIHSGGKPVVLEDYDYCWYFDGQKGWVFDKGEAVDTRRLDSGYRGLLPIAPIDPDVPQDVPRAEVFLAVKNVLVKNPYGYSHYYQTQQLLLVLKWIYGVFMLLGLILLAYAISRWHEKRVFDRQLAFWSGRLWFETKALLTVVLLFPMLMLCLRVSNAYVVDSIVLGPTLYRSVLGSVVVMGAFWWFYVLLTDLVVNKARFFSHNSINSFISWYHRYERKYPWQKMMLKRARVLVLAEALLALTSVFFVLLSFSGEAIVTLPTALLLAGVGVYLIYRYLRRYERTVDHIGLLVDHIEKVKNGNLETELKLPADADIYPAAQNLNYIQEGMSLAVNERLKSERMKVDLVTNVSHDLKTPLTSIISYVELLSNENDLPVHVKDYIAVLSQKTARLKNLVEDLFDLSKATSGNLILEKKHIDLVRLISQTLADMQEPIDSSGLAFRVNLPDEPVYILSDGKKLYRVFQNLILNTLKYSLVGSRVFVDLTKDGEEALVTIKNTANYEMDFDEKEILERFTRGDLSRTSEGSGLGLSIAQSFTQACGGRFAVKIDGDLFKSELRFKTDSVGA